MDTFNDCGVWSDDHDRLRRDSFGKYPSPESKHWAGFTKEQQRTIRESATPNLVGPALAKIKFNMRERFTFALREAWRAFWLVWKEMR